MEAFIQKIHEIKNNKINLHTKCSYPKTSQHSTGKTFMLTHYVNNKGCKIHLKQMLPKLIENKLFTVQVGKNKLIGNEQTTY